MKSIRVALLPLLMALAALAPCGCGSKSAPSADTTGKPGGRAAAAAGGLQSAVVPGADLLVHLDADSLRASAFQAAVEARRQAQGGPDVNARWKAFEEATGLGEDDLVAVLMSADLDALDLETTPMPRALPGLPAAMALAFGQPLTFPKLEAAARAMTADTPDTTLERVELAGREVLRLTSRKPDDPVLHIALSAAPHVVLVALNEEAARGMLARDAGGDTVTPPAALDAAAAHLPPASQVRMLFLASDALRARLARTLNTMRRPPEGEATPEQQQRAMLAAFLQPFETLQTAGLGIRSDDTMRLVLAADIADPEAAERTAALLGAILKPMAAQAMSRIDPQGKLAADDSLSFRAEGSSMVLSMTVTTEDVANLDLGGATPPAAPAP